MGGLVSKGIGRSVQELINIRKKIKTIGKIAEEQVKRANAKHGLVNKVIKYYFQPKFRTKLYRSLKVMMKSRKDWERR
jgi:hypothetical protein